MKGIQVNNYFPALTGLRAIAAFMVYFHHFNPVSKNIFGLGIYDFFSELHIGVTLFFFLSGFLITFRYYNVEEINFKKYLINRFSRIYPMYFILTTLTFVFFCVLDGQNSLSNFKIYLLNITFFKGLLDNLKFTGIAQGWSLTVEEFFYFLAPLFFLIIKKNKIYLAILPILFLSLGFFLVYISQYSSFSIFINSLDFMLDYTFFGRCIEFFVGMSLAIFIKKIENLNFRFITYIGFILICFFVYLLSIFKGVNGYGTDCIFGKIINTLLLPLFGIVPLFIGLIFEKTIISNILTSKLFQILGKSSYVFYLIHMGVFATVLNKISSNYVFHFLVLNIIAIFLYQYLELPLNSFIRNKANKA